MLTADACRYSSPYPNPSIEHMKLVECVPNFSEGRRPEVVTAIRDPIAAADGIVLARALGERVGRELEIPVFLYERAATRPDRENLADVRRGEFEGIRDEMNAGAANRAPDFGPSRIHPTAGAVAIGARPFLVAY